MHIPSYQQGKHGFPYNQTLDFISWYLGHKANNNNLPRGYMKLKYICSNDESIQLDTEITAAGVWKYSFQVGEEIVERELTVTTPLTTSQKFLTSEENNLLSLDFYVDEVLTNSFTPVMRRSDYTIGMYDTINGHFISATNGELNPGLFGYETLGYLQTNGNNAIQLNYVPKTNSEISIDYIFDGFDITYGNRYLLRQQADSSTTTVSTWLNYYVNSGSYKCYVRYLSATSKQFELVTDVSDYMTGKQHAVLSNGKLVMNEDVFTITPVERELNSNLILFAQYDNGVVANGIRSKIFNVTIKENDVIKLKLIPMYKESTQTYGMYDLVNGIFYTDVLNKPFNA